MKKKQIIDLVSESFTESIYITFFKIFLMYRHTVFYNKSRDKYTSDKHTAILVVVDPRW